MNQCPKCNKIFSRRDHLSRHMHTVNHTEHRDLPTNARAFFNSSLKDHALKNSSKEPDVIESIEDDDNVTETNRIKETQKNIFAKFKALKNATMKENEDESLPLHKDSKRRRVQTDDNDIRYSEDESLPLHEDSKRRRVQTDDSDIKYSDDESLPLQEHSKRRRDQTDDNDIRYSDDESLPLHEDSKRRKVQTDDNDIRNSEDESFPLHEEENDNSEDEDDDNTSDNDSTIKVYWNKPNKLDDRLRELAATDIGTEIYQVIFELLKKDPRIRASMIRDQVSVSEMYNDKDEGSNYEIKTKFNWYDPNVLVDRLRFLIVSHQARIGNHTNEIISIIEKLREANIIE